MLEISLVICPRPLDPFFNVAPGVIFWFGRFLFMSVDISVEELPNILVYQPDQFDLCQDHSSRLFLSKSMARTLYSYNFNVRSNTEPYSSGRQHKENNNNNKTIIVMIPGIVN